MNLIHLNVTEFNQILADIVHNQLQLNRLCIFGEITQLNYYHEHIYLTLSHEKAHLPCVIYNAKEKNLPVIKKGDTCEIIGQCRYLKNKGQLTFSGTKILTKGTGKKINNQQELIKKYQKNGKFELKTIGNIPKTIEKVCLITATDSAAFHDIKSIMSNTIHTFDMIHIPSSVQGLNAIDEITNALTIAESLNTDLICLARGGGAEQDFDCYFSEKVATKISHLNTPLICGIGHKINVTLCCKIANAEFETPTAMIQWLCNHSINPILELNEKLKEYKYTLLKTAESYQTKMNNLKIQNNKLIKFQIEKMKLTETEIQKKILLFNPLNRLNNGFIYVEKSEKTPLNSIEQLTTNDKIRLTLKDGSAKANIINVNKKTNHIN